jgi:hypothetical protein
MQPIRVAIRTSDPGTLAEIEREMKAMRGQEPAGAELLDDPSPRPRVADPLQATMLIALAAGLAGGAGKELGQALVKWLIERIRNIVKKRKASAIVTVAGVELSVDEDSDPDQLAAHFTASASRKP